MRIIAIVNQKGGCGKTTTAINLAALAARRGRRTLLVDMDPQSHCAAGLGIPEDAIEGGTTAVMRGECDGVDPEEVCWEVGHRFQVLPSTIMLSAVEASAHDASTDIQCRLEQFLGRARASFDCVYIDCPPALGILTFSALRAATEALIPVETGYFSLRGAQRQWDTIEALVRRLGRTLPRWIVPTIHDPASRLAARILETLTQQFDPWLAPVVIRAHDSLREAASLGQPICEYETGGAAEQDFAALLDWLDALPVPATASAPMAEEQPTSRAGEILRRIQPEQTGVPAPAIGLSPLTGSPTPTVPRPLDADASVADDASTFGAVITRQGIQFRQPGRPEQTMAVSGDFNGWSTSATPLRWNAASNAFEAIVPLPPGTYHYQVVVDGRAGPDPHNHGDLSSAEDASISVVEVEGATTEG